MITTLGIRHDPSGIRDYTPGLVNTRRYLSSPRLPRGFGIQIKGTLGDSTRPSGSRGLAETLGVNQDRQSFALDTRQED